MNNNHSKRANGEDYEISSENVEIKDNTAEPGGAVGEDKTEKKDNRDRKKAYNNLLPKIMCFVAAVLVWLYVYGDKSTFYENTYNVPVSFEALSVLNSKGYSLINGGDSTVNVKLSGTRSKINSIRTQDISVSCDLSQIHSSGEYTVPLTCNSPTGSSVIAMEPSTVNIYVDKSESKSVEVKAQIKSGGTPDLSVKIERLVPSVESIKVTGPKEALQNISHASVDIHLTGFIENTTEWTGELYLVDNNGAVYSNPYVKTEASSVKVMVEVNKYKTVPIKIVYLGVDAKELGYDVSASLQNIEIRGNKDIIDRIDYVETEPVELSEISGKTTLAVPLVLDSGAEFASGTDTNEQLVNLTFTPNNSSTKKITTKNIVMINVPDGMKATSVQNSVTVDFFGIRDDIAKLTPENVYAIADLSHCDAEGQYKVTLSIKYPDGIDGISVASGYSCDIVVGY